MSRSLGGNEDTLPSGEDVPLSAEEEREWDEYLKMYEGTWPIQVAHTGRGTRIVTWLNANGTRSVVRSRLTTAAEKKDAEAHPEWFQYWKHAVPALE